METSEINTTKLNEALEKFGSLQKANQQMELDKTTLEVQRNLLKQEINKFSVMRNDLISEKKDLETKNNTLQIQLSSMSKKLAELGRQYELFCGFITMLVGSPSVTESLDSLIGIFQQLKEPGWNIAKNAEEMRSIFIRLVMGKYLKSFRCDYCGAKFMTNQKLKARSFGGDYYCPVCHFSYGVKADDSFLKALVSDKYLGETLYVEQLLDEYEMLKSFKAFLNVPCEICQKPVKEWDIYNVKLAIEGTGCGHTQCWNSELGRMRQLRKALQQMKIR